MKRILCLIMALVMLGATPVFAVDLEIEEFFSGSINEKPLYSAPVATLSETSWDVDAFKAYLREAMANMETEIQISQFNIIYNEENRDVIRNIVFYELQDCFHLKSGYSLSNDGSVFAKLNVSYTMSKPEYEANKILWDKAVEEVIGDLDIPTLTDEQKALLIHDRLALRCEYDYENYLDRKIPDSSYTAFGCLVLGTSVCQGYAEAYQYLLELVGIDSYLCASDKLHHVWNIVNIDGEIYHVDVTWDDPVWDVPGRVLHTNFLCSSEEFEDSHEARDYDDSPECEKYDEYFWRKSDAAFLLLDGEIYYVDSKAEMLKTYDGTELCSVDDTWYARGNSYYTGNYARLATDGEDLFYSQTKGVYKYDKDTKQIEQVYKFDNNSDRRTAIYGLRYTDQLFEIVYNNEPNFDKSTKRNNTLTFRLKKECEVTGHVTVQNPNAEMTVLLMDKDEVVYTTSLAGDGTGNDVAFVLDHVLSGVYDMVIRVKGCLDVVIHNLPLNEDMDLASNLNEAISHVTPVAGDVNGDGSVDLSDVAVLTSSANYGKNMEDALNKEADINGDGSFDLADLAILTSSSNYGRKKTEIYYQP